MRIEYKTYYHGWVEITAEREAELRKHFEKEIIAKPIEEKENYINSKFRYIEDSKSNERYTVMLKSQKVERLKYFIEIGSELSDEDIKFIATWNPVIYWNDIDAAYWAFDCKLPSGRWIEHIKYDGNLGSHCIKAFIL